MNSINIKMISMGDQIKAGCINYERIIKTVEKAFLSYNNGEIILPHKISQVFNEKTQDRINCMPSTLLKERICGIKWVSVFPENPKRHNSPNVSGLIILSEIEQGYPFAIMDGTLITALRTASMGAIGASHFARRDSEVYGSIGAGKQARAHFRFIKHVLPNIKTCKVASRSHDSERSFVDELGKEYPEVQFIACESNYKRAATGADIIVTAVSCQKPLLKAEYIKQGAYYCHTAGWEDEYEVPLMADKIVCDDWEALKHRGSPTIARLYNQGKLKDSDIYGNLTEIILGEKPGRETDSEFIYFNAIGLSYVDIAVAYEFYKTAEETKKYQNWDLWEN